MNRSESSLASQFSALALRFSTATLCVFAVSWAQAAEHSSAVAQPTVVFVNGDIVTVDEAQPSPEAVAVRSGRIVAVGSRNTVQAMAGPAARVRDLQGNTLLPGLIDAHGHVSMTSAMQTSANVSSPPVGTAKSIGDVLELLRQHLAENPDAPWLSGWGYDESLLAEGRHPTREDLDKVSTEIPIVLQHVSGHFMTCNSRCLKIAGVTAETEDPQGGVIRRTPGTREPDGVLEEQAFGLVRAVLPMPDLEGQLALLDKTQQYYASHGITTVQDGALIGEQVDLFRLAGQRGLLYLDIVGYIYAPYMGEKLGQYLPTKHYEEYFRIGGIKIVLDGSPQGKTAWLTQPYLHPPHGQDEDYLGYPTLKDEQVAGFIDYAFGNNVPLIAHANGDAAADQLIAAVTNANKSHGKADRRTVMIHAQTARDDQISDMVLQGIMPSYFAAHTFYWGDWHRDSVFGVERASRISPLRSSNRAGLRYTIHNDTPVVPPDMMRLLWAAVNRVTRSGQVLGEAQRVSPMEAIKAMTLDAAYQYFEEADKGSIAVGKFADLVILDANPLKVEPMTIKDIKVLETIKGGNTVFSAESETWRQ